MGVNPLWRPILQTNNKPREAEKGVDIKRKVQSLRHSPEAAACSLFESGDTEPRCKEPSREWLVQCQNTKKGLKLDPKRGPSEETAGT